MDTPRSFYNRDFLLALFGYFFLFMAVSLFFLFPVVLQRFGPARAGSASSWASTASWPSPSGPCSAG